MASKMQNCEEAGALELVCGTVNCHVSMLPLEFYVSFVESEQDVSCSFFSKQPWAPKACLFFLLFIQTNCIQNKIVGIAVRKKTGNNILSRHRSQLTISGTSVSTVEFT